MKSVGGVPPETTKVRMASTAFAVVGGADVKRYAVISSVPLLPLMLLNKFAVIVTLVAVNESVKG